MSQHAGAAHRRSDMAGTALLLVLLLLLVVVRLPVTNPVKAALTARYQSLTLAADRFGAVQRLQQAQARRRCGAGDAGAGQVCDPPPVLMKLMPRSAEATRAAAEALQRDKARAEREFKDAWARMSPAEKKATQAAWKREWERIQAEQRAKQGGAMDTGGTARRDNQQPGA